MNIKTKNPVCKAGGGPKRLLLAFLGSAVLATSGCVGMAQQSRFQSEYVAGLAYSDPEQQLSYFNQMSGTNPQERLRLQGARVYSAFLARQQVKEATGALYKEARQYGKHQLTPPMQVMACLGAPDESGCREVATSKVQDLVQRYCHWNPELKQGRDADVMRVYELLAQSCRARLNGNTALAGQLADDLPPFFGRNTTLLRFKYEAGLHYTLDDGVKAFEYQLKREGIDLSQLHAR